MKAIFSADIGSGGFIKSTVAPVRRNREPRFGFLDGAIVFVLVLGLAAVVVFCAV